MHVKMGLEMSCSPCEAISSACETVLSTFAASPRTIHQDAHISDESPFHVTGTNVCTLPSYIYSYMYLRYLALV